MDKKRNIVVVVCDSLRASFLPMYGGDAIKTPEMDALAQAGRVFTNAITASTVCVPARSSMFTGRFVSDHDCWTNWIPCRPGIEYYPAILRDAGYDTAAFGVIDTTAAPGEDRTLGFTHIEEFDDRASDYAYLRYLKSRHPEATRPYMGHGTTWAYEEEDFYDYWITDRACRYLDEFKKRGETKPFFAYVSLQSPHAPHLVPKEAKGSVDESRVPPILQRKEPMPMNPRFRSHFFDEGLSDEWCQNDRIGFLEQVVEIDRLIGKLRKKLEDIGEWENTTVLLLADHGCTNHDFHLYSKGPYPYRDQLFIPFVVSNDPRVPAGTRSDALVGNLDLGATLLEIAGIDRPFGFSRSLLSIEKNERKVNFSEFNDAVKTVVDKRFTFSYYPFVGEIELYDRQNDPENQHNLAADPAYAGKITEMMGHIIGFSALAKGVRFEAWDLFPARQEGLLAKDPNALETLEIAYPLPDSCGKSLEAAGLPSHYTDFARDRKILFGKF